MVVAHESDLHSAVFLDALVDVFDPNLAHFHKRCTSVTESPTNPERLVVHFQDGSTFEADVVLGADGVKSLVRQVVIGRADAPEPTGDAAYRAIISTDVMLSDPDLRPFVETPEMTAWMGPGRHLMGYCIVSSQRSVPVSSNE